MSRPRVVLSLVERGWGPARKCSLDLEDAGVEIIHVVKGRLGRGVRSLIAPKPHVRIWDVPRGWFWPAVWSLLGVLSASGRLAGVLVDNERSRRRFDGWPGFWERAGVRIAFIGEVRGGYELAAGAGPVEREAWVRTLGVAVPPADAGAGPVSAR
ncbi:MAG TPA: hypothetical protein VGB20_02880 [bacterium]